MNVRKAFGNSMRELADNGRQRINKTPMNLIVGSQGGYLVPEELRLEIDAGFCEASIFGSLAWNVPMASMSLRLPRTDITAAHATGDSPLFGGLTITWIKEGQAMTESEQKFADNVLIAKNLAVDVVASNQLVADGGEALAAYLIFTISEAIAFTIDRACFQGDGTIKPLGVTQSPAYKQVTRAAASHISQADIANMVAALIPACFRRAIFCCHPTALADIANLSTYMVNRNSDLNAGSALCGTLFGRPLYVTEKLPTLGTKGDLLLFDPKCYVLGTRSLEIAASDQVRFRTNETVYRFFWRGDGQPLVKGTATLADGSTTAGVFVGLN